MIGDLVRLILEVVEFLWPNKKVMEWERGVLYWCGRYRKTVGPGSYWCLWWFEDLRTVEVVRDTYKTEVQQITTKDGDTLTFQAAMSLYVDDVALATNSVVRHDETAIEDAAAILADTLADLDAGRLDPEKRRALLKTCKAKVDEELATYGLHTGYLRFTNFVRGVRTYHLFGDRRPPAL
jgi:hypothetical protein